MPDSTVLILTLPLIPVWFWLLSNGRMPKVSTRHALMVKIAAAVGIGLLVVLVSESFSRYSALVAWAFALGCSAGALCVTKSLWRVLACGMVVAAAFEIVWGPRLRGIERRARAKQGQIDHDVRFRSRGIASQYAGVRNAAPRVAGSLLFILGPRRLGFHARRSVTGSIAMPVAHDR